MKPLFKLFRVQEVNGILSFSVDMDITADLIKLIQYLFRPPNRDLQENPKNENFTDPSDDGDSGEYDDANHTYYIIPGF